MRALPTIPRLVKNRGHAFLKPMRDEDAGKAIPRTNVKCDVCGMGQNEFSETGKPCKDFTRWANLTIKLTQRMSAHAAPRASETAQDNR